MSGGTFDLNGNSQTLAGLRGTAGTIALGSGNLTVTSPARRSSPARSRAAAG